MSAPASPGPTSLPAARPPSRVVVVGAGMVGLATAWHLQEHGVEVTVIERSHVAAGASWGNAGWLTPGLTAPLPEPGVLRYGLGTIMKASSPVYVPLQPDLRLARFLAGFARHCTGRRWARGARAYAPLNAAALDAFAELADAGDVPRTSPAAPFLAAFRSERDRAHLVAELTSMESMARSPGAALDFTVLSGAETRGLEPALSGDVVAGVRVEGQHFINPPAFMARLAAAVVGRGGKVVEGVDVASVHAYAGGVSLRYGHGDVERFDAVVLANGAWLGALAEPFGVRRVVQAGRGYSFSVTGEAIPTNPVYFPAQRLACTPLETPAGRRLRIGGMMEFRPPGAALDPRRVEAMVDAARPLLSGLDLDDRADEWVGSRPCTTDGLPLIGGTRSDRVFVGGGHGMWGVALGPITGRLLAEQIVTGTVPEALRPFDPLR